jgi:sec-independent protein translocase protein TatA
MFLNQLMPSLAFIGPLGTTETILILVVVLVLFGGKKIPEFFRGVGRGVGELQKGIQESKSAVEKGLRDDEEDKPLREDKRVREDEEVKK